MGVSQNFYLFDSSDDFYTVLHPCPTSRLLVGKLNGLTQAEAIVHAEFECSYTASDGDKSVNDEPIEFRLKRG